jgi:hypothetical protein
MVFVRLVAGRRELQFRTLLWLSFASAAWPKGEARVRLLKNNSDRLKSGIARTQFLLQLIGDVGQLSGIAGGEFFRSPDGQPKKLLQNRDASVLPSRSLTFLSSQHQLERKIHERTNSDCHACLNPILLLSPAFGSHFY